MWQFLKDGGPVMFLLVPTSIVGLAFIIERGLALRWRKIIPPELEKALEICRTKEDLAMLHGICRQQPSALGRLLMVAMEHLNWPKGENADGLISLFSGLSRTGLSDNTVVAHGISIALNTTLSGLLIAIPALIAWSYYSKKVETLAIEMETLCDGFLRRFYLYDEKE